MSAVQLLKEKGLRATPKRIALLETLSRARKPKTAEELHAEVASDLVTVYRNLQSLVAAELVSEVRLKDASVRYEFTHGHHHHLVCTECNTIEELDSCDLASLEKSVLKKSSRFASIDEHSLEFFGLCKSCA